MPVEAESRAGVASYGLRRIPLFVLATTALNHRDREQIC